MSRKINYIDKKNFMQYQTFGRKVETHVVPTLWDENRFARTFQKAQDQKFGISVHFSDRFSRLQNVPPSNVSCVLQLMQ